MSIFGGLKKALGWSGEEEDYITYDSSSSSDEQPEENSETVVNESESTDQIPEGVFDELINIINSNLSPMVLKCLDIEAEKKYLYEALGSGFSAFVKETKEKSLSEARYGWEKEKNEMNLQIEDYKSRCIAAENEMKEMKAVKLSEDRQKLALKERIRNLEDSVAAAEAEKEQYDLENKSLLNKLKVSQVKSDAIEESEKEKQALTAQIVELKKKLAENGADDERIKALEEEYNSKMEINNALLNEIRNEAVKNKEALSDKEQELTDLKKELEASKAELAEMTENMGVLDDIQEQLVKVEEFKKKKEEEVAELNTKIVKLQQENTDTLELLHKQERFYDEKKAEIELMQLELKKSQETCDTIKSAYETEINALKTSELEKTKQFQAEIAELQAKLNVNGKIDDFLVDDDLRQAVEETFEVSLDDSDFAEFVSPESLTEETNEVVEEKTVEFETDNSNKDVEAEAELEDIDWLLPDTVDSVAKEVKKEETAKPVESRPVEVEEPDAQMSLFG